MKRFLKFLSKLLFLGLIYLFILRLNTYFQGKSVLYYIYTHRSNFDQSLSKGDIKAIYNLIPAKQNYQVSLFKNQHRIFSIKKYPCDNLFEPKPSLTYFPVFENCQKEDYLLDFGIISNPNLVIGSITKGKYLILRKVNNVWTIINETTDYNWTS